jgi:hypothetical protein
VIASLSLLEQWSPEPEVYDDKEACVIASLSLSPTVGSRVYDYRVACVIASLR